MALVSPGVEVTVTDESFFIPAQAPTVPLIFVATADEKTQSDGVSPAAGTFEHDVIRTVTSLQQSTELYGIPRFLEDFNGNQFHGDARNEYGVLALNQFLGVGNRAYVIRANVNLDDDLDDLRTSWTAKMTDAGTTLEGLAQAFIDEFNSENGLISSDPSFKVTITESEIKTLARTATEDVFDSFSFSSLEDTFYDDNTIPTAPTAGEQTVNYGGALIGADPTGLVDNEAGYHSVNVGGAVLGSTATGLAGDTNAYQEVDVGGAITGGTLTGLDDSTAGSWTVDFGAALTGTSVTGLQQDTAGVQRVDVGTVTGVTVTGLANDATVYTASILIDGGVAQAISVVGSAAQTYNTLINEINADLTGATASLTNGDILITSSTVGGSSTVRITDTDLFSTLSTFVAINAPTDGFSELTYAMNVAVDGGLAQDVSVGGNDAQTFADLVNEINLDLTGASSAIVGGDLVITSELFGTTSAVVVEDGATGGSVGAVAQVQDVTAIANTAAVLDGTYFVLSSPSTDYYVWFNSDGSGNDPLPVGLTAIPVAVTTGDSAIVVGDAFAAAVNALADFSAPATGTGTITITQANAGVVGAARDAGPVAGVNTHPNVTGFTFATPSVTGEGLLAASDNFVGNGSGVAGTDGTTYTASVTVDGGGPQAISVDAVNARTYSDLVNELNIDITTGTAQLANGNLRIVSPTTGATSSVAITDTDLFSSLTDFAAINTAVPGQTTYRATVSVDGGAPQAVNIIGTNAQTYTTLLAEVNAIIGVGGTSVGADATASLVSGNFRITSETVGSSSSVVINDVTTGLAAGEAKLFGSLSSFVAFGIPVAGTNALTYTATINVNGTPEAISITGDAAQTYTDLVSEINLQLTGASAAIDSGNITVTSATTGSTSSISITDTGTNLLFASTNNFVSILTAVPGTDSDASLPIYGNGYDQPATGSFLGFDGAAADWVANGFGSTAGLEDEWTPSEANDFLLDQADEFQFTKEFLNGTSLGANDAARRVSIVTALQASVNSNTEIRAENFEFNLILCPGYHEVVDELIALSVDIGEEAFVIADTPMTMDPEDVVTWADTNTARQHSVNVAYYYSHPELSNLDGVNVVGAASGAALRTYAFSDNVSELWFAPAGTRRGLVSGVSRMGYVTGTLGGPTTFVEANLNVGQRDDLYKYFTNINPITNIPGRGILVFGQKTSSPDASALDRVNVSRLIGFIRRQLRKNTLAFVFEPNDQLTRNNLKASVDAFLGDLVVRRGLFDFFTICDESNNTPDRIDRNEMYIDVAIQPVKAAEFIFIPIRVLSTGAELA